MALKQSPPTDPEATYRVEQLRPLLRALQAAKAGDFSVRLPVVKNGILSEISQSFNEVISLNENMVQEIVRVGRSVGREGRMTERAALPGASGSWAVEMDSINALIEDLARPTTEVARVITAVAEGDLAQKMALEIEGTPVKGEFLRIGTTVNTMVDQLSSFAAEVTRVAREVGTEGKLGGQAEVKGVSGTWKDLTDNVNGLASNLTNQVRNIALVTTAVANGDLSQKITVDARGEILELKDTINIMVDQLNSFAAEVTRVAREVGTEGKLGGQAEVKGISGTWKDLTDNVNGLASNLTDQVRNIALVTTAVAKGDLSQKITVDVKGEVLELKNTINVMVDQLSSFADEVTRVAREVGTEGKLGGQAEVKGISGTWKDLTDNVNFMAGNLTTQVRGIVKVVTAVADGDLKQKLAVEAKGEVAALADTINNMTETLSIFAEQVTRVAREVGTEGKLGGQAEVKGVSGTWKDLTDNVNGLASNLTTQVRNIALVTTAVANGDLSQKITVDARGEILELKNTINIMVDQLNSFAAEVTRVAREVGTEGKLGGQAEVRGVSGTWKDLTDNVNFMAGNLTTQVRGIVKVVTAVANGDLKQKLSVEAKGEVAALAETINNMTETLGIFADQVTTVARDVGTEGILGGQAKVPNVAGTWKDLTDNVNFMAGNLTTQVRGIAKVVTAVADGDLRQKLAVEAKGEVAALAETINNMTETLGIFAEQVTTVAREVGTEGKLGGQARVPNAAGTWKDLTDNVNFMANSLTVQVRAISDVATAVTEGDLSRSITVEAQGEVSSLKDNLNQMIGNLKETTTQNREQDWLKTNLARFSQMMQGQKNLEAVARLIMSELTPLVTAQHGVFYVNDAAPGAEPTLKLLSSYAYRERKNVSNRFQLGEGLVGQCALEKKSILLTKVPSDYVHISSGLGESPPMSIFVLPVLFEGDIMAVIELASFQMFSQTHVAFLEQLMETLGVVLNMITANMRTEELLTQSQSLTQELQSQSKELQSQQEQLKSSNVELEDQAKELEDKASLLAEQNNKVELKNREVELARAALEEKAEQLALSSRYKSEFLANMSHELRTPLNSMLILAKLLADNKDNNLTPKQTEFAHTIHASGGDLLNLINEILDLSKVEAGKMEIDITAVPLEEVQEYVERTFSHVAQQKGLEFGVEIAPGAPATIATDMQRLQQVLRNLLSNAFKFTEQGQVGLTVGRADGFVAFSVSDTGIGIPKDKQNLIFEAFQQADGTTSRKYGGTGLGLSISREIARLLGGRIRVDSEPGRGSTFTLLLPEQYQEPAAPLDLTEAYAPSGNGGGSSQTPRGGARNGASTAEARQPFAAPRSSPAPVPTAEVSDDRNAINPGDRTVLIIEDDVNFAGILMDMAQQQGFKAIVSLNGDDGLELARQRRPNAITLDLRLEGADGWTVLDQLKRDPDTRHIPVQVISVMDRQQGTIMGAISYLEKPVSREALEGAFAHMKDFINRDVRSLLLVEDDDGQRAGIAALIGSADVEITAVSTGEDALTILKTNVFDCMVLDLTLPGMGGLDLLKRVKKQAKFQDLPVIIYTGKDLTKQEENELRKYAATIITKDARSSDRLLDETALFLHRIVAKMPGDTRKVVEQRHSTEGQQRATLNQTRATEGQTRATQNQTRATEGQTRATEDQARATESQTRATEGQARATEDQARATAGQMRATEGQTRATAGQTRATEGQTRATEGQARETEGQARVKAGTQSAAPDAPNGSKKRGSAKNDKGEAFDLTGHKILLVDDDMRNIFALTSVLEAQGLQTAFAENGKDGIQALTDLNDIDLVLMDIMMPGMDGYETMSAIRDMPQFETLPIIALTAKAMSGDREKCLQAGASDYIPKPVDPDQLLTLIRRWLEQQASKAEA